MATFRQTVTALLPTIHYPFTDAVGSGTAAQIGSSAVPAAVVSGAPTLGFPPILQDGSGDTCCFQQGNNVDVGWHIANDPAWNVAATDDFSLIAVVAAFSQQPQAFAVVASQFGCTNGAYELHVQQNGFIGTYFQDVTAAPTIDQNFPPVLADGVPHIIAMVRKGSAPKTLQFWVDALLVATVADGTAGSITNAGTAQRIGCRVNCGGFFTFNGAYSNVAFFRSLLGQAQFTLLHNALWGGTPPASGAPLPAIAGGVASANAKIDQILAAVKKTY